MENLICSIKKNSHILTSAQRQNIDRLIKLSQYYNFKANIRSDKRKLECDNPFILESGHQPNFFPYPGVWKKVFLLDWLADQNMPNSDSIIPFFGFADQNLSTAKLLYENKVPALNKQGSKKFGFKIEESDRWKTFRSIEKPSREVWDKKSRELRQFYLEQCNRICREETDSLTRRIDILTEIMEDSYNRADNMADLNAFIFSRVCTDYLGFNVFFFRYSDIQREAIFIDECRKITGNLPIYRAVYNSIAGTVNLPLVESVFFPFWYHCSCGGKVALEYNENYCNGTCPICNQRYQLPCINDEDFFRRYIRNLGPSAVARNIIFAEGLGTMLFISGTGGGLRYGKIADAISRKLSLNVPVTLSWKSRDYYLGITHEIAIKEIMKMFNLAITDITEGSIDDKIRKYRIYLDNQIQSLKDKPESKKELARYSGLLRGTSIQISMIKQTFSTIPSMIDLAINFNSRDLVNPWVNAIQSAEFIESEDQIFIKKDVVYFKEQVLGLDMAAIPSIYNSIASIIEHNGNNDGK